MKTETALYTSMAFERWVTTSRSLEYGKRVWLEDKMALKRATHASSYL